MSTFAARLTIAALLLAIPNLAAADDHAPVVDLPDDAVDRTDDAAHGTPTVDTTWGLDEQRRNIAFGNTSVGGYGELHYNLTMPEGEGDNESEIDLHRLVIFLAHRFNEDLSTYIEFEVEHAFAGDGAPGEVSIEQAHVDYRLFDDALALRAGMVLVPMGMTNLWHEPPVFNGVERPMVEKVIIPTTWREAGIGLFGEPADGLQYELYVLSGLDPLGFSGGSGIRGGRQKVAEAITNGPAVTGRIQYEPTLGVATGLAAYYGNAGPNAPGLDLNIPVLGVAADARVRRAGFEAKFLLAFFSIGNTDELAAATDEDGVAIGSAIGSQLFGTYVEAGYDVLHGADTEQQLVPFARFELYDTAFAEEDGVEPGPRSTTDLVFGLSYRPHPAVAFKGDVILRSPEEGDGETVVDLGVGWMF